MACTQLKTLGIARDPSRQSKGQKAFNNLIGQIEKKRALLAAWEAALPPFRQKVAAEMLPLVESSMDLQIEMVHCLDRAYDQKGLTKTERRLIAELITDLAGEVAMERDDADLKAIYNKHSHADFDRQAAVDAAGMKDMLEDIFGVEFGDDFDLNSPEDVMQHARAKMQEAQAQADAERQARAVKRKKSAKQLAREAQQQAEAQEVSQSIREVYRKLASALHPDRENDPAQRQRKTALMQRANAAYAKNDLLRLLELQLELEHIDQAAIDNLSEERLKHYNKVLKEQLAELDHEILHVEGDFRAQSGMPPFAPLSPATLMRHLERDIANVRQGIQEMKRDLLAFGDIKKLKAWLKEMRRRARRDEFFDVPF